MKEGFDVCLEITVTPKAFADILPNMFMAAKSLLGIMLQRRRSIEPVALHSLTLRGIYGRKCRDDKMISLIQSGVDVHRSLLITFLFNNLKKPNWPSPVTPER